MVSGIGTGTTKVMDLHDEAGLAEDQMDVVVGGLSVPGGITKKQPKDRFDLAGATDHIDKHPTDPKSNFSQAEAGLDAFKGKGHASDPKPILQLIEQAEADALKGGKDHTIDPKLILQKVEAAEADALKSKEHGTDTKAGLQQSLDSMIQQEITFIKDLQDATADQMSKISRG